MWDPGFEPLWQCPARVHGWHRKFSLVSTRAWGSKAAPGLCAVLHPGGSSWGRVICVAPSQHSEVQSQLDRREAAYLKHYATVDLWQAGKFTRHKVLTYVVDQDHPRLNASLDHRQKSQLIRQGIGEKGTSMSYLTNTVACLAQDGHTCSDAHKLLALVDG